MLTRLKIWLGILLASPAIASAGENIAAIANTELVKISRLVSNRLAHVALVPDEHHVFVAGAADVLLLHFEPHLHTVERTERYLARLSRPIGKSEWQVYSINVAGEQSFGSETRPVAFMGRISAHEISEIAEELEHFWQAHARIGNIGLFSVTSSARPFLVNDASLERAPELTHYSAHVQLDPSTVRVFRERYMDLPDNLVISSPALGNWQFRLVRNTSGGLTISHIETPGSEAYVYSDLRATLNEAIESSPAAEKERKRFDAAMAVAPSEGASVVSTKLKFERDQEQYMVGLKVEVSESRKINGVVMCHRPVDSQASPTCAYQTITIEQTVPHQLLPVFLISVELSEPEVFELVQVIGEKAAQEFETESVEPFTVLSIKRRAGAYEAKVNRRKERYTITVSDEKVGP